MDKTDNIFLIIGACGVGKTTLVKELSKEKSIYKYFEIDGEIVKKYSERDEDALKYLKRVGITRYNLVASQILQDIVLMNRSDNRIILVDMGNSATCAYGEIFPNHYTCIHLNTDPKFIWNNRQEVREIYDDFNQFFTSQFKLQERLHNKCQIKIDTLFLDSVGVKSTAHRKIQGFINSMHQENSLCLK